MRRRRHRRSSQKQTIQTLRKKKNEQARQLRELHAKVKRLLQARVRKQGPLRDLPQHWQEQVENYKFDAVKAMEALEEVQKEMQADGMVSLLRVHSRGKPHSGEVIEMCMKLMSRALTAPQARDVVRDLMTSAYPNLQENHHYRIPSITAFKKYRRILYAVANFRMIRAINEAEMAHCLHDASTKKRKQIFRLARVWRKTGKLFMLQLGWEF